MKSHSFLVKAILFLSLIMILESVLLYIDYRSESKSIENLLSDSDNTEPDSSVQEVEYVYQYTLDVSEDYTVMYNPNGKKGYRYGPSIMKHDDGTMDMWVSRPGNNSTQWDYIAYRHFNGEYWSDEEIVLRPNPGSKDQCSVCDPAAIYFNGYYYLGYTGTSDYDHEGLNNSAFVARSKYPDGPFEKWNGSSWGGDPEPLITYWNEPIYWGVGELSFVVNDEELFIYYTLINKDENSIRMDKASLDEDWPLTVQTCTIASYKHTEDSYDVVYDDNLNTFLAFSIYDRMKELSQLIMFESSNGREFEEADYTKINIKDYSHNMGIAKSETGHIDSSQPQLIGYAYGREWGSWPLILQYVQVSRETN